MTNAEIKRLFVALTERTPHALSAIHRKERRKHIGFYVNCLDAAEEVADALIAHGINAKIVYGSATVEDRPGEVIRVSHVWVRVRGMVLDPKSLLMRQFSNSRHLINYWDYESEWGTTRFATVPAPQPGFIVPDVEPIDD